MKYLMLALVLAVAVSAVNCTKIKTEVYDVTREVEVTFDFQALAPVRGGPGVVFVEGAQAEVWGFVFRNASAVYAADKARSAQWEKDLEYAVEVEHWSGAWTLSLYNCTNGTRWSLYWLVEKAPNRTSRTITFTVPQNRAEAARSAKITSSVKPPYSLCEKLPNASTWPNCKPYHFDDRGLVKRGASPGVWEAMQINGLRPGGENRIAGVWAVVSELWYVDRGGEYPGTAAHVSTDLSGAVYIGDVRDMPFTSRVRIEVLAAPRDWGFVELRPPKRMPLYISKLLFRDEDFPYWSPPAVMRMYEVGNATYANGRWTWRWTMSSVAVATEHALIPHVAVREGMALGRRITVRMPLGSAAVLHAAVVWLMEVKDVDRLWIGSHPATYLRVVDDEGRLLALHYEEAGARGKLSYEAAKHSGDIKWAEFAAAVDASYKNVTTAWYSPPNPCDQWPYQLYGCRYEQAVYTKMRGGQLGYAVVGQGRYRWNMSSILLVTWLAPAVPWMCEAHRYQDVMRVITGDPVLYYHVEYLPCGYSLNPSTGDLTVRRFCGRTRTQEVSLVYKVSAEPMDTRTATPDGRLLRHVSAQAGPWFYDYFFERCERPPPPPRPDPQISLNNNGWIYVTWHFGQAEGQLYPAGWVDVLPLSAYSMPSNSLNWSLALVPVTACPSLICTEFKPAMWGPTAAPDLALPGAGYAFYLQYLGNRAVNASVKVYVERGYVVGKTEKGIQHREVKGYLLAEIKRVWRPFDAVYVGPGWHLDARGVRLEACRPVPLGERAIYATPVVTGDVQIKLTVEAAGTPRVYVFNFTVSNLVSYKIATDTLAPASLTAPYLNATVYLYLAGIPYFHGLNAFGEGGRQRQFACVPVSASQRGASYQKKDPAAPQLAASGDFWGHIELYGTVKVNNAFTRPRFELVDPRRGVVKITAEGPAYGFAFYAQRNGTWTKVVDIAARCVLVDASRVYPWDPVLILPLVRQTEEVAAGGAVTLWRPQTALLFKTWADPLGYPKGAKSELRVVGIC